jgi:transposase-like protein
MSKRLQVLLNDREFAAIRDLARREGVTVSEWVRQLLRTAQRERPVGEQAHKLAVVRTAAGHSFPTGDIEDMLAEIELGYRG